MVSVQEGKCKICKTHQDNLTVPLNVDHNHITKKVRGLLCGNCNRAFGLVNENITTLENMIKYKLEYE